MALDEPRQERTLVHVIEHRRQLQGAGKVFDDFDGGGRGQLGQQFVVVQNEFAQAVRAFFVELVAFHRGEHGAKNFRPENVGKGIVAFASEPEQQFAARRMLIDQPGQRFLEQLHFPFRNQQIGKLAAQFRGNKIQRITQHFMPVLGIRRLE